MSTYRLSNTNYNICKPIKRTFLPFGCRSSFRMHFWYILCTFLQSFVIFGKVFICVERNEPIYNLIKIVPIQMMQMFTLHNSFFFCFSCCKCKFNKLVNCPHFKHIARFKMDFYFKKIEFCIKDSWWGNNNND